MHKPESAAGTYQLDDLLSIPLRNKLNSDLESLRADCDAEHPVSALVIDVDKFKQVNDLHGHEAGDEVLVGIVSSIGSVLAGRGTIYRYGGDELVVLLPNHTIQEASATAERIRAAMHQMTFAQFPDKVTLSVGVASYPANVEKLDYLFKAADKAMYQSKESGGNAVSTATLLDGATEPASRVIRADIASRVEAVELWISVTQCNGRDFSFVVENDNDEDVKVEAIVLRVGALYLSRPAKPGKIDKWIVPAHSRAQVSGEFPSDPTRTLGLTNPARVTGVLVEIDIVAVT
jgi:diguanylate cyclase (GGDEF)-like protein